MAVRVPLAHRPRLHGMDPRTGMAAPRGFEPRQTDSKSAVLPLDEGASDVRTAFGRLARASRAGAQSAVRIAPGWYRSLVRAPPNGQEFDEGTGAP